MSVRPKLLVAMLATALTLPACSASLAESAGPAVQTGEQWASSCKDWDEWDKPGPPYKIHGNTWYVGTCGITALLVTGDEGHILIDTGTEKGSDAVLANVGKAGFDPKDIRVLLVSHEHHDHVGGAAHVLDFTGARLLGNAVVAAAMRNGNVAADDPQRASHPAMRPVASVEAIDAGTPVTLGDLRLTMVPTPGHTSGASSWQWQSCEAGNCRTIVYADSLTPVSSGTYRFSDHPEYVAAFRRSIARVAALDCDILLSPHPSASMMRDRLISGSLAGGMSCGEYAKSVGARLDERLAEENAK
ncbi:MAG: subclass B3 metallo-beta-lactamase [Novosphingobium sp.]|nr:subclass B3 metallo-beta-lactamase [Novosphingobium sp.]